MKKSDLLDLYNGGNQKAYPGRYMPLSCNMQDIMKEIKMNRAAVFMPLANLCETKDHYQIDIAAPGHKKEDFLVYLNNRILDIVAFRQKVKAVVPAIYHIHEFEYDCFERKFILPKNVDADNIKAEYIDGILRFYLSKTTHPEREKIHKIIVY